MGWDGIEGISGAGLDKEDNLFIRDWCKGGRIGALVEGE